MSRPAKKPAPPSDFSLERALVKEMRKLLRSSAADLQEILLEAEQGNGVNTKTVARVVRYVRLLLGNVDALRHTIPRYDDKTPEPAQ